LIRISPKLSDSKSKTNPETKIEKIEEYLSKCDTKPVSKKTSISQTQLKIGKKFNSTPNGDTAPPVEIVKSP